MTDRLPELRPSAVFILGDRPYLRQDEVWEGAQLCGTGGGGSGGIHKGRVSVVTIKRGSHFFPLEKVDETARECATWIQAEAQRCVRDGIERRLENERIDQELSPRLKGLKDGFAVIAAAKSKV